MRTEAYLSLLFMLALCLSLSNAIFQATGGIKVGPGKSSFSPLEGSKMLYRFAFEKYPADHDIEGRLLTFILWDGNLTFRFKRSPVGYASILYLGKVSIVSHTCFVPGVCLFVGVHIHWSKRMHND